MTKQISSIEGVLLGALTLFVWEYFKCSRSLRKFEKAYWGERRGRARVEREMKKISDIQLNTSEGFFVQPIGEIDSCYRQCIGTPRQGLLVPASRAALKLTTHISPEALVGLDTFSHVWITFKFHLNTNTLKESKAFTSRSTFNAKISLPMLKSKLGVLATRSPHRPNPVGVTLAKIDRIDKANRIIHLCGCDLVQGTPVLDVKPYVPAYDTVDAYSIPDWIADTVYTRNVVTILPECKEYVQSIQHKLKQYHNCAEQFIQALIETLEAEVRSLFQTNRRMNDTAQGEVVEVPFDETIVSYRWLSERKFEIVQVELRSKSQSVLLEMEQLMLSDSDKEEGDKDENNREAFIEKKCDDAEVLDKIANESVLMRNNISSENVQQELVIVESAF